MRGICANCTEWLCDIVLGTPLVKPFQDWLIDYLRFYVPLKNLSLIWRHHHCWWRAAKFRPMLGAQGLWAGRDLYRATPVVTRDLGFSGLIWRTAPFSRLLRHTRGCGGSILTRFTGCNITGRENLLIYSTSPSYVVCILIFASKSWRSIYGAPWIVSLGLRSSIYFF
jgi:hypothetical protein